MLNPQYFPFAFNQDLEDLKMLNSHELSLYFLEIWKWQSVVVYRFPGNGKWTWNKWNWQPREKLCVGKIKCATPPPHPGDQFYLWPLAARDSMQTKENSRNVLEEVAMRPARIDIWHQISGNWKPWDEKPKSASQQYLCLKFSAQKNTEMGP